MSEAGPEVQDGDVVAAEVQFTLDSLFNKQTYVAFLLSMIALQFGQYHVPSGIVSKPTQRRWNHLMAQSSLSQQIISP